MTFLWAQIEIGFNPITFRYYNDLFCKRYLYSLVGLGPEFVIGFYRLYLHMFKPNLHADNQKSNMNNKICLLLTFWGPIYYSIDAVISIWEGTFLTPCRFSYFYHHVISITVQPVILSRRVYHWWDIMVCATHALLVCLPSFAILNYLYIGFIFAFNLQLLREPYSKLWENRFLAKFFPFIYYCFFLIHMQPGCDSSLPYICD